MSANINPTFVLTPRVSNVRISTANTNHDGSGTTGTAWTAGTNGSRIDRITVMGTGASTTAGFVRFFITDGSNIRVWFEVLVTALTPSSTVAAYTKTIMSPDYQSPLEVLQSGYSLLCATHNAEQFDIVVQGGDF